MNSTYKGLNLDDFIGNSHVVDELRIELEACKRRGVRPDHMLITGYSGTGKTRLANTVATECNMMFMDINSPQVEDLYHDVFREFWVAEQLDEDDKPTGKLVVAPTIVFFDEAHDLPKSIQTVLLKIMLEATATFNGTTYLLNNVTFVFATTDGDKLLGPLKQRCELRFELQRYTNNELSRILRNITVQDGVKMFKLTFSPEVCQFVAERSRHTPRIGLGYMKRLYNHARAQADTPHEAAALLTVELAEDFFRMRRISRNGLTPKDIEYLRTLHHSGKPMGVSSIAAQLEVNDAECKRDIEPFLRYCRLINFDKGGRSITPLGIDVLRKFDEREEMEERIRDMAFMEAI